MGYVKWERDFCIGNAADHGSVDGAGFVVRDAEIFLNDGYSIRAEEGNEVYATYRPERRQYDVYYDDGQGSEEMLFSGSWGELCDCEFIRWDEWC